MKSVLIIGDNELAYNYTKLISTLSNMKVIAIIKSGEERVAIDQLAEQLQIAISNSLQSWIQQDVDIILETTGNQDIEQFITNQQLSFIFIRKHILEMLLPFIHGWSDQI